MKILRVQIVRPASWYPDFLGCMFDVEEAIRDDDGIQYHRIVPFGAHENGLPEDRYLRADDVEIFEEREGDVIVITSVLFKEKR